MACGSRWSSWAGLATITVVLSGCSSSSSTADVSFFMEGSTLCNLVDYPATHEHILWDRIYNTSDEFYEFVDANLQTPDGVTIEGVYTGPDSSVLSRDLPAPDAESEREWAARVPLAGASLDPGSDITYYYLVQFDEDIDLDVIDIRAETVWLKTESGETVTASPSEAQWLIVRKASC